MSYPVRFDATGKHAVLDLMHMVDREHSKIHKRQVENDMTGADVREAERRLKSIVYLKGANTRKPQKFSSIKKWSSKFVCVCVCVCAYVCRSLSLSLCVCVCVCERGRNLHAWCPRT